MPPPLKSDEVKEDQEEINDGDDNSSVFLSLNPITNSSGSAFIQLGDGRTTTKIFVSVFGPKKTTSRAQDERVSKLRGTLDVSVTLASFASKSFESSSSHNIKDVESDLTEKLTKCLRGVVVLESFPKAVVEVRCVVADANGDELRGLVLATSSALMHARVEVRDILCACTAVIEEDGEVRLVEDYNNTNDAKRKSSNISGGRKKTSSARKAVGAVTVAYMPRVKKVTNILSVGRWGNANDLKKAEELAMQGCEEVAEVIKAAF